MSKLIDGLKTGTARTANGAVTNLSTLDSNLDMFFIAWASRNMSESDVIAMFSKAFAEDKNLALKILFWARDVRGWAGERRFFRIILKYLAEKDRKVFNKLLSYVAQYGRWDDLFFDEEILSYTLDYIDAYIRGLNPGDDYGLLFKWLPREKSSNRKIASIIRKRLGLSSSAYRKLLADNSRTVEQQLSAREYSSIEYASVPSKAFNLYRNAFKRHDEDRFSKFIEKVEDGEETINASSIFPVDIFKSFTRWGDRKSIDAQWSQLPDYLNDEDIMPVCDTSGSMWGYWGWDSSWEVKPIDVSISLWVYLSERTKGRFKDHFITFEGRPRLQSLSGTATDRFEQIRACGSDMSTNIQWVFQLILDIAKRDNLSQEDIPSKLMIISDMEFNYCGSGTNFEAIQRQFEDAGFEMPQLVFWNVNWRMWNNPAQKTDKRVALVSGYSPSIVKSVLGWEDLTPMWVMMKTVWAYSFIDDIV